MHRLWDFGERFEIVKCFTNEICKKSNSFNEYRKLWWISFQWSPAAFLYVLHRFTHLGEAGDNIQEPLAHVLLGLGVHGLGETWRIHGEQVHEVISMTHSWISVHFNLQTHGPGIHKCWSNTNKWDSFVICILSVFQNWN